MTREFEVMVQEEWVVWLLVACGAALCFAGGYVWQGFHLLSIILVILGIIAVVVALAAVHGLGLLS